MKHYDILNQNSDPYALLGTATADAGNDDYTYREIWPLNPDDNAQVAAPNHLMIISKVVVTKGF